LAVGGQGKWLWFVEVGDFRSVVIGGRLGEENYAQ